MSLGISKSDQTKKREREKKPKKKKAFKKYTPPNTMDSLIANTIRDNKNRTVPKAKAKTTQLKSVTKEKQLKKTKKDDPKKMNRAEYENKCDWLFFTYPKCQVCNLVKSAEVHHARYGYRGRDDRTIIAICKECHHQIHHGKEHTESKREYYEDVGIKTHTDWKNSDRIVEKQKRKIMTPHEKNAYNV